MSGKLYLMSGIPASGKSTFAKQFAVDHNWKYISRDVVRFSMVSDKNHYFDREDEVWREYVNQIVMHLQNGDNVIADATHLNRRSRMKLINAVRPKVVPSEIDCFVVMTPFEECLKRNSQRIGMELVPDSAMYNMNRAFKVPTYDEPFENIIVVKDGAIIGKVAK